MKWPLSPELAGLKSDPAPITLERLQALGDEGSPFGPSSALVLPLRVRFAFVTCDDADTPSVRCARRVRGCKAQRAP